MLVIIDFDGRIDAATHQHVFNRTVFTGDFQREVLLRLDAAVEADDVVGLGAIQLERLSGGAVLKLQGQHAHADEIGAVNALKTLRDDDFDAEQVRALGRPVARRTRAVFLAREDDQRRARFLVGHGRIVNGGFHAVCAERVTAFFAAEHEVLDADVGKRAAGHDAVVAAP